METCMEKSRQRLSEVAPAGNHREIFRILGPAVNNKATPSQPQMRDDDGQLLPSYTCARQYLRRHFDKLLQANRSALESLICDMREQFSNAAYLEATVARDMHVVPTLVEIGRLCAHVNSAKACGPWPLGPEILKRHPHFFAAILTPFYIKVSYNMDVPFQMLGGGLQDLPKKPSVVPKKL